MAIIYTYGYDSDINGADALIGTDSTGRKTKQFRVSDLTDYISENISVVAGVNTITTTNSTFISLTPSTPQNGDVIVTSALSASGTANETTYLRGDNTWASIPPGLAGSGTTNYITKWSATDTLTDSVIYDDGSNVGIGTNSPLHKLEIYDGESSVLQAGASYVSINSEGTSTSPSLIFNGETGTGLYRASADTLAISTAGSERMRITSTGNVGIGTTSPIVQLHVIGDTVIEDTSAVLALKSTQAGSTSSIQFESLSNAAIIGGGSADYLSFFTASNHRMRILANGNVGIGTTNPTQSLHVNGSVRIADVIYDSSNSPGTAGQVLYKPTNDTIGWVNRDSITSVPTSITATPGGSLNLASNIDFVYFTWSGGSGTYTLNLPSAASNAYRIIRFVCDSTVSANDKVHVQGSGGDTVDGGLFYTLNKPYNGVQVWSDGSQWIVIQAKAT